MTPIAQLLLTLLFLPILLSPQSLSASIDALFKNHKLTLKTSYLFKVRFVILFVQTPKEGKEKETR